MINQAVSSWDKRRHNVLALLIVKVTQIIWAPCSICRRDLQPWQAKAVV